jgi:8-oxo-dGTP pyrophosphatase MutT (NUDIX family)
MSHHDLHVDALRTLTRWQPPDEGQRAVQQAFLAFLAARPDATARRCEPGHLTASAVVFDASLRSVLLTLHPRVGRWVQLGGHCEEQDETLAAAALREATEESGIVGLTLLDTASLHAHPVPARADPVPLHLDVHAITCSLGRPTRHFDVRFAIRAPVGSVGIASAESRDLRFWPADALPEATDESLRAAVRAAASLVD